MTERMYTLKDMASAWDAACAWGWYIAWAQELGIHRRDIGPFPKLRAQQLNPYREQEEA